MSEQQPGRVTVDRAEYETFLVQNKELMERYRILLDKVEDLTRLNNELQRRLQMTEGEVRGAQEQAAKSSRELQDKLLRTEERLRENEQLVQNQVELAREVDTLKKLNQHFQEKLHKADEELDFIEKRIADASKFLNRAFGNMSRLIEELRGDLFERAVGSETISVPRTQRGSPRSTRK